MNFLDSRCFGLMVGNLSLLRRGLIDRIVIQQILCICIVLDRAPSLARDLRHGKEKNQVGFGWAAQTAMAYL
jgi:hypothetical protein